MLTRNGYCLMKIKKRIVIPKKHSTENVTLDKQLYNEYRKILVRSYIWSIILHGSRDLETKKIGAEIFGELRNMVLEENEVLEGIGEKSMFLSHVLCIKANKIGHILRRICLFSSCY
jgi:hypothetical protein